MLSTELPETPRSEMTTAAPDDLWQEIRTYLEQKRDEIYQEIRHYPPPIPACDQQFNYLLEQRTQVHQALRRVEKAQQTRGTRADAARAVAEFVESSTLLDADTQHRMRARLPLPD